MKYKFNIAGLGIILTIFSVYSYIFYKAPVIEKKLQKTLLKQSNNIINTYKKLSQKNINNTNAIYKIIQKNKNIVLFTIIKNGSVLVSNKNNKYLSDNDYRNVINNFILNNNSPNKYSTLEKKYYNNKKYYLYPYKTNNKTIIIMFAYKLNKNLIINIILELSLICIAILIFCLILYIAFKSDIKKAAQQETPNYNNEKNDNNNNSYNIEGYNYRKSLKDIFREMYNSEQLSSLSLTVYNNSLPNIKYKYNYLRNEIYKYEDTTKNIESQKDLFQELKNGHNLYIDKNKKLLIPIILEDKLTACLNISSQKAFSGSSLQNIKQNNLKMISAIINK